MEVNMNEPKGFCAEIMSNHHPNLHEQDERESGFFCLGEERKSDMDLFLSIFTLNRFMAPFSFSSNAVGQSGLFVPFSSKLVQKLLPCLNP
jgi:hypothetical protein